MQASASVDRLRASRPKALLLGLAVVALWIPLFVIGTAVHESLHAVAVLLLGSHPVLVLRPWPMALLPLTITGIHVQPVPALDPLRQGLDNFLGPAGAALLFGVVAWKLPFGPLRLAMLATALGLVFFAIIEVADVMLDGRLEVGFLTAPEFNYGVPLLLAVTVAALAPGARPGPRVRPQVPSS